MTKEKEKTNGYGSLDVVNVRLVKEPSFISDTPVTSSDDAVALIKDLFPSSTEKYSASSIWPVTESRSV